MAHPFELSHEIEVDASPEEVWEAIATGPGVDSWFMGRNEIEPRVGGATRMDLGGSAEETRTVGAIRRSRTAARSRDASIVSSTDSSSERMYAAAPPIRV